ncbi:MAG TPA: hypothetical protein VGM39_14875 [Kofleriaceae bacterium]|jgi:hypothetical protein
MRRASITLMLVAACGKSAPSTTGSGSAPPPPPPSPLGTTPHLFAALEGVEFGAARADVLKKLPELKSVDGPHPAPYTGEGWVDHELEYVAGTRDGTSYRLTFSDGTLLQATLGTTVKRDELLRQWGADYKKRTTGAEIFLDRTKHVRATVTDDAATPISITLEAYVPLETYLDKDPTKLLGVQIIGGKVSDVIAALTPHSVERTDTSFDLPPTEYSDGNVMLVMTTDEKEEFINTWLIDKTVFRPSTQMSGEITALCQRVWGVPTPNDPRLEYVVGKTHVIVDPRFGSIVSDTQD